MFFFLCQGQERALAGCFFLFTGSCTLLGTPQSLCAGLATHDLAQAASPEH